MGDDWRADAIRWVRERRLGDTLITIWTVKTARYDSNDNSDDDDDNERIGWFPSHDREKSGCTMMNVAIKNVNSNTLR